MSTELKTNVQYNTQEFIPNMINYMDEMCKDHVDRMQSIKSQRVDASKVNDNLSKGLWYPTEYCQALQKFNQKSRLEWSIKSGASYHGFMPKTFTPVEDINFPTKRKVDQHKIAKGETPSSALESIQNSVCLIGCGTVRDIAAYRTLQDLLGKEKFNLLFASDSSTPLALGTSHNPYKRLFNTVELLSTDSLEPGDFCYFSNIQQYMIKHPLGPARGYNVIYEGNSQFLGLGLKSACLATDVEKALLDAFNASPYAEELFDPSIIHCLYTNYICKDKEKSKKLVESFKDIKLTQKQFDEMPNRFIHEDTKTDRRMLLSIERPDLNKIKKLTETPIEHIRSVFSRL